MVAPGLRLRVLVRDTVAMNIPDELSALFHRDLTRLLQQLQAFPSEGALWERAGGISNSAGNLVLHLEGNLREYIGRQLGKVPYRRERALEFSRTKVPTIELVQRIEEVRKLVPAAISRLSTEEFEMLYPEKVLGASLSTRMFLIHLYGHLNYHLGQIDYLRRVLTGDSAVDYAGL